MVTENMDGYRYFFPAGWAFGVWGVLLWILFPWNLVSYPGAHHPEIMTGGFFLCFVCGFLMTAAPRFTATFGPTKNEQMSSFVLIAALFLSLIPSSKVYFYSVVTGLYIFLLKYLARRFLQRKANPPDSFIFVGVGVGIGLLSSIALLIDQITPVSPVLVQLARLLFMQGYVLCLVMGVGSRLIPALLGWAAMPNQPMAPAKSLKIHFAGMAALFVGSYVLEAMQWMLAAHLLRAAVMSFIVFYFWKIHKFPARRAYQSWWLWASAWFMLLGQWGTVFFLHFRVHLLHVILVSGLGLMTLMIAIRVSLSHGHHGMDMEKSSKVLWLGALLISLSGLTRWSAGLAPAIYQSHLLYAAIAWLIGLAIWGWLFLPKIVRVKSP
jgi:uncharacterized protein involved in response to NO